MPKRTTPRQRMIALVRQHLAGPGVTVTESKNLLDQASGQLREVDVVAEGEIAGEQLVVSVEVTDRTTRKADVTWVDAMVAKHLHLPTNQLNLVSWSGFTRGALAQVDALPRVSAVTPTPVLDPDGSQRYAEALYVDQITLSPERAEVRLRGPDGTIRDSVPLGKAVAIHDEDGKKLGVIADIADGLLKDEEVGRRFGIEAHGHEDREKFTHFTLLVPAVGEQARRFLRNEGVTPPELHEIEAMKIIGTFRWQQTELKFAVVDINGRAHGIAQAPMLGKDSVWVATPAADDPEQVRVAWRPTHGAATPHEG
jgi:hypothetical protein